MSTAKKFCVILLLSIQAISAGFLDTLFEPIMRSFNFLPEYNIRFDLSTFAFHRNSFLKRQYLAEPHPELDFCFISYKNIVASVWHVDFQFGLGEVPGNNTFTVLNVAFGIEPSIEVRLKDLTLAGGVAHRCIHEIDRSDFPIVWYNKVFASVESRFYLTNRYWSKLTTDSSFSIKDRLAWKAETGYFLKEFFGLAEPSKLNGTNPAVWECSSAWRFALYKRRSWLIDIQLKGTLGIFDKSDGYHVSNGSSIYWKQGIGLDAFFIRGAKGGCFYGMYHLDDLPAPQNAPAFTLGNSRFSKNGLLQIGVIFFN